MEEKWWKMRERDRERSEITLNEWEMKLSYHAIDLYATDDAMKKKQERAKKCIWYEVNWNVEKTRKWENIELNMNFSFRAASRLEVNSFPGRLSTEHHLN